MSKATIANLQIILGLDDTPFQRGIEHTRRKLEAFGESLKRWDAVAPHTARRFTGEYSPATHQWQGNMKGWR